MSVGVRKEPHRTVYRYDLNLGRLSTWDCGGAPGGEAAALPPPFGPGQPGALAADWNLATKIQGRMLTAVVGHDETPLARIWIVVDPRDLAHVVSPPRILDLPVPVCIVETEAGLPSDSMAGWLGRVADLLTSGWLCLIDAPSVVPQR